ncbi:MAG: hypothetical protein KFB96_22285 [Thiocapsa sp.]|uniref:hypothetical protein n=1 Tax=Thiocapsa sp. TaxID=2024551 RepID=UPI001BCBE480|nr:hypothetical protein [Thiocapsa sp.]QVL48314.1 MAG: hypothetical protein KFB96_22285 [Thiocapsa sp.]
MNIYPMLLWRGLDHRLVQLLVILASSGLPALILSGQDGLTTHSVTAVGEGMIEAHGGDLFPADRSGCEHTKREILSTIRNQQG